MSSASLKRFSVDHLRMRRGFATLASIVFPLRMTREATPTRALHGQWHTKECAHVCNGTVQLLKVHIQRLALRTARLLVHADALHVEAFENRLGETLARVLYIRGAHF